MTESCMKASVLYLVNQWRLTLSPQQEHQIKWALMCQTAKNLLFITKKRWAFMEYEGKLEKSIEHKQIKFCIFST